MPTEARCLPSLPSLIVTPVLPPPPIDRRAAPPHLRAFHVSTTFQFYHCRKVIG